MKLANGQDVYAYLGDLARRMVINILAAKCKLFFICSRNTYFHTFTYALSLSLFRTHTHTQVLYWTSNWGHTKGLFMSSLFICIPFSSYTHTHKHTQHTCMHAQPLSLFHADPDPVSKHIASMHIYDRFHLHTHIYI